MAERVPCIEQDCSNTILPSTGRRTGGLCMPCVHAKARQAEQDYIRKNRRVVNEFEDVTNPVEALTIIHRPRKRDRLIEWTPHPTPVDELYTNLTEDQQTQMLQLAMGEVNNNERCESDILLCLTAYGTINRDAALTVMLDRSECYPGILFHQASEEIRDRLLRQIETDRENQNHLLLALAWIGDDRVVAQFATWRASPPSWRNELYIPPEEYSKDAGWELDENGRRRDLILPTAYSLNLGSSTNLSNFQATVPLEQKCTRCGYPALKLFDVAPSVFGFAKTASRIQILACSICPAFGLVHGKVAEDGRAEMNSEEVFGFFPEDVSDWGGLPENAFSLGKPRSILHAANWSLPTSFSQLGGHPCWIQDFHYQGARRANAA